jgi:hypothetical protein
MDVDDEGLFFNMDYGLNDRIIENQIWLSEQLTQLGHSDLNAKVIGELVAYFGEKTNNFYRDLLQSNKMVPNDLFEQELSIAAGRIVNAAEQAHAKEKGNKKEPMLSLDDVIPVIIYSGELYENAISLFPNME